MLTFRGFIAWLLWYVILPVAVIRLAGLTPGELWLFLWCCLSSFVIGFFSRLYELRHEEV